MQDYYTFRAEFEKLVSPRIQKALLPEYIKNNYLEGHALQIVREFTDLDEIWGRLKTSFGDVMILISNKMYDIERGVPLWKIRNDEKLIQSLLKLKNCMIDLRYLAIKLGIGTSLFHSSNLAKIYHII